MSSPEASDTEAASSTLSIGGEEQSTSTSIPSTSSSPILPSATSSDLPPSPTSKTAQLSPSERSSAASNLKDEGNQLFLKHDYEGAKVAFGKAIALDPSVPQFWSNRAACELKLEQHGLAIEDAKGSEAMSIFGILGPAKAICLDASFAKAYYRRASAFLSILDPKSALPDLRRVAQLEPNNKTIRGQVDATTKLLRRQQFEKAIVKQDGPKAWQRALETLRENLPTVHVEEGYEGPKLKEGPLAKEGDDPNAVGPFLGAIDQDFIDKMIEWFKDGKRLPMRYAWQIMLGAQREFLKEGTIVDYTVPEGQTIDVIGDTHGQYYDLLNLLSKTGRPSNTHALLFNGDAVDRGSWSCEVVLTILAYKWLYPKTCFFNRGNHETHDMNTVYGFEAECKAKFNEMTYKVFTDVFVSLPLATLITASKPAVPESELPSGCSKAQREPILFDGDIKRFFVVHGGLFAQDGVTLDNIRAVNRFAAGGQPPNSGIMHDMLWADPCAANGRAPSKRGVGYGFGPDISKAWCTLNKITAVFRSHEVRQAGYDEVSLVRS
ncbi:protein phosphatase 5 [Ceraceosorus guamensis]|uniref:Serine/threonine-protein phosphatase n=1 Tax=Ceraceosorus guamensis TaxID=1522189 RepID=A0A316VYM6_9BASI|nr:protein phosphatase 5 [Ceraceosorus guamensis]PWN42767.1 protein phosphatase 5 [Ceraceosorus guamensis]